MPPSGGNEDAKRHAGEHAADYVEDGMIVGLGTGSTAAHAIRALGERIDAGLTVRGVPTSYQSRALARQVGVPLASLEDGVDIAIDGADQIVDGTLVKGGGAAHAREKVVASAADRFVVVVDETKLATRLDHSVPIEVLPAARPLVVRRLGALGGDPQLRAAERKEGPVVTDNGNLVLDCSFGEIQAPADLATDLDSIPGIVAHGLFIDMADAIIVGTAEGTEVR